MGEDNKKILIFSTAYFPFVGGAEVAVKEITARISDIEFEMITARLDRKLAKTEKIGNVLVHRFGIGWPMFDKYLLAFFGGWYANKLQKKNQYQAIWSIMASYGGFAALGFKEKNKSVPFLLTLQEGDDFTDINKRVGIFKKRFLKIFQKADYIQCISHYLANWARENGAKCTVEVVPNGAEVNKFRIKNVELRMNEIKEKLGILKEEKVVITISRLVKKNGVEDLIKAMDRVSAKLLVLGSGEEEKKLQQLVINLNLKNKIRFLGHVPHDDLPKYLWSSNVFCRPSLSEGLGNVFLEAMAAGVPVVGTPVGGIVDFLKDRETGLFCQTHNPKSITEKINELLQNNGLRKKLINNGQALVKEKYDWQIIAKEMKNIFEKLFL